MADPVTGQPYSRDPRHIAQKAEKYLESTGIADTAYFGPEPEFFVLDDVRFDQTYNQGYYFIDATEGFWNSGKEETPIWATSRATRRATFQFLRWTLCRICERK